MSHHLLIRDIYCTPIFQYITVCVTLMTGISIFMSLSFTVITSLWYFIIQVISRMCQFRGKQFVLEDSEAEKSLGVMSQVCNLSRRSWVGGLEAVHPLMQ